jgi:CDP-4-dehydro-6-deoxyglucose reductase/ferredoxin-NAD(P)+ reductase (naphthalene dioxygenase ferredoxin-specific)
VTWTDEAENEIRHPQRRMSCRLVDRATLTHDITRLRLAIETGGPFAFSAGQYAALCCAELPPRDYSMANRPDQALLEFHVRRMGVGSASAYVTDRLRPGERVIVDGPFGTCYLRETHDGPILALAGGSGLAPIKSIVETALAQGRRQPIHLYYGARDERDIYLEDHFRALAATYANFRYTPVLSEPRAPNRRRSVHEALAADFTGLAGAKAYLAGPPAMVEAAARMLEAQGVPRHDIHADAFYSAAEKRALDAVQSPS